MKYAIRVFVLVFLLSVCAISAYAEGWSGFVYVDSINSGAQGEFLVKTTPPAQSTCGSVFRIYANQFHLTQYGQARLYNMVMIAMLSDKQIKLYHSAGTFCYVHNVELTAAQ